MIEELRYPKTKLYYWKNKMGNDLLFCIADYEPMQKRYKYVETILDLAEKYEAEMLFTISAFTTHIQHDEEPKVFAAVNSHELITYLNQWDIAPAKEIDLSSINALILGLAQKRNIHGIFLLSEVPSYTTDIANPKSGMAVTSVLSKMLDLNIDMVDIRESARLAEIDIDKKIKAASWEFIDQFTVDYRDLFQKDEDQE
jgi:proteasome assembly chaperone (PAC2) family protein